MLSSSLRTVVKKLVGGSCFGSPTTIRSLPRAIAPTASQVGIWDASSKMTRSNFGKDGSIYCATEIGDISIHGQRQRSRFGMLSKSLRIAVPRPPERIARWRIEISEDAEASSIALGIFAESIAASSCLVRFSKLALIFANCRIFSSTSAPLKSESASSPSMT